MPSKKIKGDQKEEEPLKPLSHYVKDRLELTKQLFSCLKKKQVKSRLPVNLQKKSIERIQQICLDEILGISTKRLVSIINNTPCPDDTESDSEIEHISLSEISSSESDIEDTTSVGKSPERQLNEIPLSQKSEKEMTMLELLELQARARAIRSQLALEPVTKIELDSDEEEQQGTISKDNRSTSKATQRKPKKNHESSNTNDGKVRADGNKKNLEKAPSEPEKSKSNKTDENKQKSSSSKDRNKLPETSKKIRDKSPTSVSIETSEESISSNKSKGAPPIKLKRNFKGTELEGYPLSVLPPPIKEKTPPKEADESRSSSPDVITMEQNIATYFISDSEDEEPPPKKKSPSPKVIIQSIEILPTVTSTPGNNEPPSEAEKIVEKGELNEKSDASEVTENDNKNDHDCNQLEKSLEAVENKTLEKEPIGESINDEYDDNIVNIMSDTEIDLNINSDEEPKVTETKISKEEKQVAEETPPEKSEEAEKQSSQSDYDGDVVEIHTSDDELDSDKPDNSNKNSNESETWEQRYMKSSNVKNVLQTSKLAAKVRDKIVRTKRSETAAKKQKEKERKEKEVSEKISHLEEGSMEQFNVLKESSN